MEKNMIQKDRNTAVTETSLLIPELRESLLAPILHDAEKECQSIVVSFRQPASRQNTLQLSTRTHEKPVRKKKDIQPVKICLHDGRISVNDRKMSIPAGLPSMMTGREFKQQFGIYAGNSLFVSGRSGMQRIRDKEKIEIMADSRFTHRAPKIRSTPRFGRD